MPRVRALAAAARLAALLATLFATFLAPRTAAADDLESLGFLAGSWGEEGEVVEHWLPPLRGLMVGINRDPQGEGAPFFEYLRIESRPDGVVYVASPRGGGTTDFRLTEVTGSRAVFANPDHDFPQTITYVRDGDRLEVEAEGEGSGGRRRLTFSWSRVDCDAAEPAAPRAVAR